MLLQGLGRVQPRPVFNHIEGATPPESPSMSTFSIAFQNLQMLFRIFKSFKMHTHLHILEGKWYCALSDQEGRIR